MGKEKEGRVPIWARSEPLAPVKWTEGLWKHTVIVLVAGGIALIYWRYFEKQPWLWPLLILGGIISVLLFWKLPGWQVSRSNATDENRFDRENEARKTLAQIVGGMFVLFGLYSSLNTLDLSREGQITERFTRAIEQLGASDAAGQPKLELRLGGIYALERIARDSERDYGVIMEVLTTYVREHSPRKKLDFEPQATICIEKASIVGPKAPAPKMATPKAALDEAPRIGADIQAILTVLGRRELRYDKSPLDLSATNLRGAHLHGMDFRGVDLHSADLREADFEGANLRGVELYNADLRRACLTDAHLEKANLGGAKLWEAKFHRTHLNQALFPDAHLDKGMLAGAILTGATLNGANLCEANLKDADLREADLTVANLRGVDLGGADLRNAVLEQKQIDSAMIGDRQTKLPSTLKKPESWPK